MDTSLKARMSPHLGLLTISGLLERAGHGVRVVNGNVEPVEIPSDVDLVGISVTVDVLPQAIELAKICRAKGVRHIMFIDDNFIGDLAFARQLVEAMRPLRLKWNAAVSANIVDHPDLLDLMRETGCLSLFIGFESISAGSVAGVHKRQNDVARYEKLVGMLHDRGIMINASFVFGLDSDGPSVFRDTLDWVVRNRIETVTSHILTPYPGTALYERMKGEGRLTDTDLSHYDTAHVVFKPKGMSAEELYAGYLWIYREVYSWKNIIRRTPRSLSQFLPYYLFNLFYRKYGRFTERLGLAIGFDRVGALARRLSYWR